MVNVTCTRLIAAILGSTDLPSQVRSGNTVWGSPDRHLGLLHCCIQPSPSRRGFLLNGRPSMGKNCCSTLPGLTSWFIHCASQTEWDWQFLWLTTDTPQETAQTASLLEFYGCIVFVKLFHTFPSLYLMHCKLLFDCSGTCTKNKVQESLHYAVLTSWWQHHVGPFA